MTTLYLDIETAKEPDELLAVGHTAGLSPVRVDKDAAGVAALLQDSDNIAVTHSKYDLRWLRLNEGLEVNATLHDTMVMAWLINENTPLDLDFLAWRYSAKKMDKRLKRSGRYFVCDDDTEVPIREAPWDQMSAYCARDVDELRNLYQVLKARLEKEGLWEYFDEVAAPFTNVLLDMECRGLPIDVAEAGRLAEVYRTEADALLAEMKQGMPEQFNPRSNPVLRDFLANQVVHIKASRRLTEESKADAEADKLLASLVGEALTDDDRLKTAAFGDFVPTKIGRVYEHGVWVCRGLALDPKLDSVSSPVLRLNPRTRNVPFVQTLLRYRKLDKLLGTYVEKFPRIARDGRVYARFNQTGTVTGRLSSSDPNLQNIPARGDYGDEVRKLFVGNLVVGDFSQLEPRLMAHFSQDPEMLRVFQDGEDLYTTIAQAVMAPDPNDGLAVKNARQIAKVLVLAMGYGAGAVKVAEILSLNGYPTDSHSARTYLGNLQQLFATYFEWRERTIRQAGRDGSVSTLDGRLRRIENSNQNRGWSRFNGGWQGDKGRAERQAANAVIQGSAADIVTRVMLHSSKMFPKLRLLAQVHDELVWEYDPAEALPDLGRVQTQVERLAQRGVTVPLVFEPHFGANWYEAKSGTGAVLTGDDDEDA